MGKVPVPRGSFADRDLILIEDEVKMSKMGEKVVAHSIEPDIEAATKGKT